ncbi:MAG TPA: hypothetical protein OIM42_04950 [Clostridiaceae bacterium]|nr:hypothetical protein [Clostridiaceae bacterium]
MSKLSLKEFNKLSENEKGDRYKELSEHDKFLVRISMPIGGEVIGYRELTEQEKKEAEEFSKAVETGKIDEWFNKK